jgi:gluconate 2-dehydrogenase gamma chain
MSLIDRRSLLQRALLLAGATLAPSFTVEALAQATQEAPRLLDSNRFALLSAVADTIVPKTDTAGAIEADVPANFDALLRVWASPQRRTDLIGALDRIDRLAREQEKQGFASLSPEKRYTLLAAHDAEALKPPSAPKAATPAINPPPTVQDPNYGRAKEMPPQTKEGESTKQAGESIAVMAGPPVTDPAYSKLKELIVTLYYVSEQGLTQELEYDHTPGEWKPSIPVTPETRPSGGIGPI